MRAIRAAHAGSSRSRLYRGAKSGKFTQIARGIYLPADAPAADWDQLEAVTRRPEATLCLITALAHYDLTNEIPEALDIAIPRGTRKPQTEAAIRWHHFDRGTFDFEREEILIPGSEQTIGIYTPERTIADCFRLRSDIGYEIARDATREWLSRGGKPAQLIRVASGLPRATSPVMHALEMMS